MKVSKQLRFRSDTFWPWLSLEPRNHYLFGCLSQRRQKLNLGTRQTTIVETLEQV